MGSLPIKYEDARLDVVSISKSTFSNSPEIIQSHLTSGQLDTQIDYTAARLSLHPPPLTTEASPLRPGPQNSSKPLTFKLERPLDF